MKLIKVKKNSPPMKVTPTHYTVTLTEGEADVILGLLGATLLHSKARPSRSPYRLVERLQAGFEHMLRQDATETDTFRASIGVIYVREYR